MSNATAFIDAARHGHLNIVNELLRSLYTPLHDDDIYIALEFAAICGHLDIVKKLLYQGNFVNKQGHHGRTILMLVCLSDSPFSAIVEELLKFRGINVNLRDYDGKTALDYAKEYKHTKIVKLLKNFIKLKEDEMVRKDIARLFGDFLDALDIKKEDFVKAKKDKKARVDMTRLFSDFLDCLEIKK